MTRRGYISCTIEEKYRPWEVKIKKSTQKSETLSEHVLYGHSQNKT